MLLHLKDQPREADHLRTLKRFAFQMFDMNCDKMICETDIFTFLESHREDEYLKTTLNYDMQDIIRAFKQCNEKLKGSDPVMDYSNEAAPRIKDLKSYVKHTKQQVIQRKKVQDRDVFGIKAILQHTPTTNRDKNKDTSAGENDLFSAYGAGYKQQFKKYVAAPRKKKKTTKKQLPKGESEENKAQRHNVTETYLEGMRSQGAIQIELEQKKRPQLSYYIAKKDEIAKRKDEVAKKDEKEHRSARAFLKEDEFVDQI